MDISFLICVIKECKILFWILSVVLFWFLYLIRLFFDVYERRCLGFAAMGIIGLEFRKLFANCYLLFKF